MEDIYVDEQRTDFVFYGLGPMSSFDPPNARMLCALSSGDVESATQSMTIQVTSNATVRILDLGG